MRQHRDARLKKGKDNLLINTTKSAEGGPSFSAVPLLRTTPSSPGRVGDHRCADVWVGRTQSLVATFKPTILLKTGTDIQYMQKPTPLQDI